MSSLNPKNSAGDHLLEASPTPSLSVAMPSPFPASLTEKLERWQNQVREPSLTVLLIGQVGLLFLVSPLSNVHLLPYTLLGSLQVLLLVISYFALPLRSKVRRLLLVCLVPIIWVLIAGSNQYIGLLLRMVGILGITVAVGQAVFRAQRVTRHQLLGAVVVYLNLAQLFMGAFIALDNKLPGAFTSSGNTSIKPGELLYFSLTTLTSTGYGDILPVHPLARSLANLEAVVGQLFLAILLARLVSQQKEGTPE
ncbi:MAG: potassium channel family protein [Janthinobacterium lividum]